MTRNEIMDLLTQHKAEMRQAYGVQEIVLFGSYARQSAREDSDKKTLTNFF